MSHDHPGASRAGESTHAFHPVCDPVGNDEYGTVIFDGGGRIRGCGAAADSLFGAGQGRITGRLISQFVPDIHCGEGAPGYHATSLASLCATSDWQQFEAMDVHGRGFAVGIRLSRRMTNGHEVFVLNFCRPGEALFAPTGSP